MNIFIKTRTHLVCTNAAVVGSLGSREAVLGPTERMTIEVKEGVFLLNAEPGLLCLALVGHLQAGLALVGVRGGAVELVGVAHHQDVVAATEGVLVDGHRVQVGVRVGALGLIAGAAIVVPNRQLCNGGDSDPLVVARGCSDLEGHLCRLYYPRGYELIVIDGN